MYVKCYFLFYSITPTIRIRRISNPVNNFKVTVTLDVSSGKNWSRHDLNISWLLCTSEDGINRQQMSLNNY